MPSSGLLLECCLGFLDSSVEATCVRVSRTLHFCPVKGHSCGGGGAIGLYMLLTPAARASEADGPALCAAVPLLLTRKRAQK